MSLMISDTGARRLPDVLVNSSWVTNLKQADQQTEQTCAGEKILFSPPNFDRVDLSKAVSLDDKMVPGEVQNAAEQADAIPQGTEAEMEEREISQMRYADGSFNFSLPEDAVQRNVDVLKGKTITVSVYYSPEAKRNQARNQMLQEWNSFVEQLKASVDGSGMDYFESQRFIQDSFTSLVTDWMHNQPELFKSYFDQEEERFANHEWDLLSKPEGWTDADFAYWKNYDPWKETEQS